MRASKIRASELGDQMTTFLPFGLCLGVISFSNDMAKILK